MAYQSRHSGEQIDTAVDKINEAVQREQLWYNLEVAVTKNSWKRVTTTGAQGKYTFTTTYKAFSEINKFPSVYFVDSTGQMWDLPAIFNSTTNPTSVTVYSNTNQITGTLVICSNSGYKQG